MRSSDLLITRMITDRIGLHSVLLPLQIWKNKLGEQFKKRSKVLLSFSHMFAQRYRYVELVVRLGDNGFLEDTFFLLSD